MTDPNKPIIGTRTTVEDWHQGSTEASSEPYTPATATQNNYDTEEATGVEDVRYDKVTNAGAPVNPSTPQQAQRQALSLLPSQHSDPAGYTASNYAELIEQLQQRMASIKPLTKEEIEKKKRQQRTEGIISGIADAAQAISNLFFTSQYAPNMYNPKEGMSAKAQGRFDKAKAQRDADDERYMNYALQLGRARDAVDALRGKEQQQNITLQLKMNEDARRQAKAEHDAEMADIDLQIRMGKLDYEGARTRKAAAEARLAEAYAEHADERVISEINRNNRANRGGSSNGGSSYGRGNGQSYTFVKGNESIAWDKSRMTQANLQQVYNLLPQEIRDQFKYTDSYGEEKPLSRDIMLRAIGQGIESPGVWDAIRRISNAQGGKKPNPMGGDGSGNKKKKKNPMS